MAGRVISDEIKQKVYDLAGDHTVSEVHDLTGVSESTLRLWQKRGVCRFKARGDPRSAVIDRAAELLLSVSSWAELAERMGVRVQVVRQWGARRGWDTPGCVGNKLEYRRAQKAQAKQLAEVSLDWYSVAVRVDVPLQTVLYWAQQERWQLGSALKGSRGVQEQQCLRCQHELRHQCSGDWVACADEEWLPLLPEGKEFNWPRDRNPLDEYEPSPLVLAMRMLEGYGGAG